MQRHGRELPHPTGTVLLSIDCVSANYGGRSAIDSVSLQVSSGQRIAVVGPNGAGKSTLFKVVASIHRPTSGTVQVYGSAPGRHVCIAYVEQSAVQRSAAAHVYSTCISSRGRTIASR